MTDLVPRDDIPEEEDALFDYLVDLVEQARQVASLQANATLTLRNWLIGRAINVNILRQQRADYGKQIVVSLAHKLTQRFGSGFDRPNVNRMMQFAQLYPEHEICVSLAHKLSWTHIVAVLPLKTEEARAFYIEQTTAKHLGIRELRRAISRKAYERREIANAQIPEGLLYRATRSPTRCSSTCSASMTPTPNATWKRRSSTTCVTS